MIQEEVGRITDACDVVCANCDRKTCYDCIVDEVRSNALNEYTDDECPDPDENFFDDEDIVYPDPSEDVWDGTI